MGDADLPESVWDEFDWERFMQAQDRKTERYMRLLQEYRDHPDRDAIIAREMGWNHLFNADGTLRTQEEDEKAFEDHDEDWEMEAEWDFEECEGDDDSCEEDDFGGHPLYKEAFSLTVWVDEIAESIPTVHPDFGSDIAAHCAVASAKIAAALSDREFQELGMTIAYLKRALSSISAALAVADRIAQCGMLAPERSDELRSRIFHLRNGIVDLTGEFRAEWRRRFGSNK